MLLLLRVIVFGGLTVHDSIRGTATVIGSATGISSGCGGVVALMITIVGGKKSSHNWPRNQREDACCALTFDGCGL